MNIIEIKNLTKSYGDNVILDKLNLEFEENKMIAIVGSSGKGKSTLLNIIGFIEEQDSGTIKVCGYSDIKPNTAKSAKIIRNNINYLFQNFALLDNETVKDNLLISLKYINLSKAEKLSRISDCLKKVGLLKFENRKIFTLSGGEQQRVAISRLFLNKKKIILADEPTGSLDKVNSDIIMQYLSELNKEGCTIIIVTHDLRIAEKCDYTIEL